MKKRERILIISIIMYLLIISLFKGLAIASDNVILVKKLNLVVIILISILLVYFVLSVFYVRAKVKKNSQYVKELLNSKKFDIAITFLTVKKEKSFFGTTVLNATLLLAVSHLAAGDNGEAREIIEKTKWRRLNESTFYHRFLFALFDDDLNSAENWYRQLSASKNKHLIHQKNVCKEILEFIETDKPNEKIYKTSIFPIVESIYYKNTGLKKNSKET